VLNPQTYRIVWGKFVLKEGKMRIALLVVLSLFFSLGCARVRVEAPKEPIKVDISMRLDIYQHVEKDINAIEDIVSGAPSPAPAKVAPQSFLNLFLDSAFAADGSLSPEVEQAALRRRDRLGDLNAQESKGIIGENKSALVEIRASAEATTESLVRSENSDRMIIYKSIAEKNGTSVEEVQKLYAKKLQENAPSGTPIEAYNASTGKYSWSIK
jgi:uncharacterized protein YdbL (DUF1318 family)